MKRLFLRGLRIQKLVMTRKKYDDISRACGISSRRMLSICLRGFDKATLALPASTNVIFLARPIETASVSASQCVLTGFR